MKRSMGLFNRSRRRVGLKALFCAFLFSTSVNILSAESSSSAYFKEEQIALSQPLAVRWRYDSDQTLNLTPATDGERLYLSLTEGVLVSLQASDGQLFWKAEMGGEFSAASVADERGVYIATEIAGVPEKEPRAKGSVRELGREGGVTLWMRTLPFPLRGSLAMSQTALFGGASDGRLYAFNKRTGEVLWIRQPTNAFSSRPVLSGSSLYIGGEDGSLFALDQKTGKQLWRYRTRGAVRGRPAVADGVVYFGSADGYVYALSEETGRLRWRTRTGAGIQAVAHAGRGLLVASLDNFVYLLSLPHGARLWKHQLAGRLTAEPLTATDGALFTPLSGDAGVVLDLHDGKVLNNLPIGEDNSIEASPIIVGNMLFLTTRHGLLAFSRPN